MLTKRTLLMLSAVTTLAVSSMAAAQPNGGGRFFSKMDANADGAVTLQEFERGALTRFDRTDANQDGKVTPEERKAAFEAFRAERADKRPRGGEDAPRRKRGEQRAHPLADKTVSKANVSAKVKEHFSKLDKNNDGKLTQDEMKFGKRGHGSRGECGKKTERS